MSSLAPEQQLQAKNRRTSSFLHKIFRKSTGNVIDDVTEEGKKDKSEEPKQLQPNFVLQLQEKMAQMRYGICNKSFLISLRYRY